MTEVTVLDIPVQKVIGLRQKGCYAKIGDMIPKLVSYIISLKGVEIVGAPIFVCHETADMEAMTADQQGCADIEICVPISGEIISHGEFKVYELPGGQMASVVYKGPYKECGPIYQKLFGWILEHGYTLTGPTREVYLSDPCEVPEEDILTEILAPIAEIISHNNLNI